MPFFGEVALPSALQVGGARVSKAEPPASGAELSGSSFRAINRTCLLTMSRADGVRFASDLPDWGERMRQRRHLLLQASMHAAAMQQAMEKHQEDVARPSTELRDALALAKASTAADAGTPGTARDREGTPKPPPPAHPHAPPRVARGKVADQAQRIVKGGVEVYQVACQMGLNGPQ